MKKQSGMEPTPRDVRERYAPWTRPKQTNGEEKKEEPKKEVKAERQRDPRDLKLSADGKYYYPEDK
jgi:hypothetical protein